MDKKLYSTKEAAIYLGFSVATLKSSRSSKILAGVKPPKHSSIGTRSIRYHVDDLEDWIDENAAQRGDT